MNINVAVTKVETEYGNDYKLNFEAGEESTQLILAKSNDIGALNTVMERLYGFINLIQKQRNESIMSVDLIIDHPSFTMSEDYRKYFINEHKSSAVLASMTFNDDKLF